MRYLRFVVAQLDKQSGFRQGVIQAAHDLLDAGRLQPHEEERVRLVMKWLSTQLPEPTRFGRTVNWRTRGLSWFKDTAGEHLGYIRELVAILEAHDVRVDLITSERPGYIIYEDELQIVAEPFTETGA